jgi:hypothetical protein
MTAVRPRTPIAAWGGAVAEGGFLGQFGDLAVAVPAERDTHAGDGAGGVAGQGGHDAGGDADGAVVGVLQGVPSVGDEFADLVRHYRFESGGDADRFRGEGVHGFPDARELS